jgi:hypothetical protein
METIMSDLPSLPSLFNPYGTFIAISDEARDALSDVQRAVYEKVKRCAADLQAADLVVAAAIEHVKASVDAVKEFEDFMRKAFPPMTHFDLLKQVVKGQ